MRIFNFFKKHSLFTLLAVITIFLRLTNLGYSDYQGDEIKALFLPEAGISIPDFLLDQRKGPMQFLITYLTRLADPNYSNELLNRLPFAIAGILAVLFFYKFIQNTFKNEKMAFFASFFMATCGFFLAFSRIVQYQSFVILFMVLSLYFLQRKDIFGGLLFWALSILSHYDGIFIAPLVFYFIYVWFKEYGKTKILTFVLSGLFATTLLASFYVPFAVTLTKATTDYWQGRISGDVSGKLSSSSHLFSVYQPIYVIHIYRALFILGFSFLALGILKKYSGKKTPKWVKNLSEITELPELFFVFIWFLVAFLFMEVFVYVPGTHIYTYLVPVFIIMAYGIHMAIQIIKKVLKSEIYVAVAVFAISAVFLFITLQSYAIFVENKSEYPWEDEKFLLWTLPKPSATYHLSLFGFPYYRNWEGIANFVRAKQAKAYSTNERVTISRYYLPIEKIGNKSTLYVYIRSPQSFEDKITYEIAAKIAQTQQPEYVFTKNGIEMVEIYTYPPEVPTTKTN